jgi:hypothetical protein
LPTPVGGGVADDPALFTVVIFLGLMFMPGLAYTTILLPMPSIYVG